MGAITSSDQAAVSDGFVELILADPDLLAAAFASVVASWQASPPQAPTAATTRSRPPAPPAVPPWKQSQHRTVRSPGVTPWQLHVARSPPTTRRSGPPCEQACPNAAHPVSSCNQPEPGEPFLIPIDVGDAPRRECGQART
jgi:hypothetical protein